MVTAGCAGSLGNFTTGWICVAQAWSSRSNLSSRPLQRRLRRVTLETGLFLGAVFFVVGFGGSAWITWKWAASGFGPLQAIRWVLFWSMWLFIGVQVIFSSFCLSMLGISRDTYIGDY